MNGTPGYPPERRVVLTHDGPQHCTAQRLPDGNTVAMDCPYTGKGPEFSPTNMVEAALAGCMLISMGAWRPAATSTSPAHDSRSKFR
jgi:uncharacterized OsmC-like protein